jgi:hypothetical protein
VTVTGPAVTVFARVAGPPLRAGHSFTFTIEDFMSAKTDLEKLEVGRTVRMVRVRPLRDVECITHHLKKGVEVELQSDHANVLAAEGKVEILTESAMRSTSTAEKRVRA